MKTQQLITDLRHLAFGVASLHKMEDDENKKQCLEEILTSILKMLEYLESDDDSGDKGDLQNQIWIEIVRQFLKLGLEELFERLLDFGFMTYGERKAS